jgi:hypothetical protein
MNPRRCPHCGEYLQSNSLTCPRCFKEIPRVPNAASPERVNIDEKKKSGKVPGAALLLAVIPPFFGLLGLGLIYLHPKDRKGYLALILGLLLFLPSIAMFIMMRNSGFFSAVLLFFSLVALLIFYVIGALVILLETISGSFFKMLRV